MTHTNRIATTALTAVLVFSLSVSAFAAPAAGGSGEAKIAAKSTEKTTAQKRADAKAKAAAKKAAAKEAAAKKKAAAKAKAAQKRAEAKGKTQQNRAKRKANLQKSIENRIGARNARFSAATANIERRIARVSALASRVEAAGGDVAAVRAKLDEARAHLAKARSIEGETATQLRAIPGAEDWKGSFKSARSTGRTAVAELKAARAALRDAMRLLSTQIETLLQPGSLDATTTAQ